MAHEDDSGDERTFAWLAGEGPRPSLPASPPEPPRGSDDEGVAPRQLGRFQLLELLGRGGMGEVYRAVHVKLHKQVALKLISPERMSDPAAVERFRREIQLVSQLKSPNVVRFENAGEAEGIPYLVMEYVQGVDLDQLVRRLGPLPVADACQLVGQAALGLEHAHAQGLVHRDINPSNLMLADSGALKILDFGLALLADAAGPQLTRSGRTLGVVQYLAPEQAQDSRQVDIRADIYALGCTFFKLLTGQTPFAREPHVSAQKIILAHVNEPPPDVRALRPEVPRRLADVVARMLAKDPDDRYHAPLEVARALARFAVGCDVKALLRRVDRAPAATGGDESSSVDSADYLNSSLSDTGRIASASRGAIARSRRRRRWIVAGAASACLLLSAAVFGVVTAARWLGPAPAPRPAPQPPPLVVVDWDQIDWPDPRPLSRTFPFDDVEATITLSGDTQFNPELDSPNDNLRLAAGAADNEETLLLATDWQKPGSNLTVTLAFSAPVKDVAFQLIGVDVAGGEMIERVDVQGRRDGTVVRPKLSAEPASRTAPGNLGVNFEQPVDRIVVTLRNGSGRPAPLEVALHDVKFTVDKPFGGTHVIDWDDVAWQRGRAHAVAIDDLEVTFTLSGDRIGSGTGHGVLNDESVGGERALRWPARWGPRHEAMTLAIDFSAPVEGLEFPLYDLDADAAGCADQVLVRGFLRGSPVRHHVAALRGSLQLDGDTLVGRQPAEDDPASASVSFSGPVDRVTLQYAGAFGDEADDEDNGGKGDDAEPAEQAIALGDLRFHAGVATGRDQRRSAQIVVPATANIRLAGQAAGTSVGKDSAPGEAPLLAADLRLEPGGALRFLVTGVVRVRPGLFERHPDGGMAVSVLGRGGQTVYAPDGCLVGLFLPAEGAASFSTPAETDTFTRLAAAASWHAAVRAPALHEVFVIGDGYDAQGGPQQFVVPDGASRLYLGVMDVDGSHNNVGSYDVQIESAPRQPAALLLASQQPGVEAVVDGGAPLALSGGEAAAAVSAGAHRVVFRTADATLRDTTVAVAPGQKLPVSAEPAPLNLLDRIVPERDVAGGSAQHEDGGLRLEAGAANRGLVQLPLILPEEYDLRVVARRLSGNGALGFSLTSGTGRFTALLDQPSGGEAAAEGEKALLARLAELLFPISSGLRCAVNGSPVLLASYGRRVLPTGQAVELLIRVRADGVRIETGGETIVRWQGDPSQLTVVPADEGFYGGVPLLQWQDAAFEIRALGLHAVSAPPVPLPLSPPDAAPPERLAAERALWKGGVVQLRYGSNVSRDVAWLEDLPPEPQLHAIHARDKERGAAFDDADLRQFAHAEGLVYLELRKSRITNAGLQQVGRLAALETLLLSNTAVTDEGLAPLGGLTNISSLYLVNTQVSDAGMLHLRGLTRLKKLGLSGTRVGDEGIAALAPALTGATWICLCNSQITGKALAHLKDLQKLETLHVGSTDVGDADLVHLYNLESLKELRVVGTDVTETGKAGLQRFRIIDFLD